MKLPGFALFAGVLMAAGLFAAPPSDDRAPQSDERIMGVIPNYAAVEDPAAPVRPLTVREKFKLFARESTDPYTIISSGFGAALSQIDRDTPKYGNDLPSYAKRFAAAQADVTTQNFFSDAVLASVFHEDPRYFRKGPEYPVLSRVWYSLTRLAVTRKDGGGSGFNYSGVLGMSLGIALSNAYYPGKSVNGSVTGSRFVSSLTAASLGNLLPEFWPDVKQRLLRHRHAAATDQTAGD